MKNCGAAPLPEQPSYVLGRQNDWLWLCCRQAPVTLQTERRLAAFLATSHSLEQFPSTCQAPA